MRRILQAVLGVLAVGGVVAVAAPEARAGDGYGYDGGYGRGYDRGYDRGYRGGYGYGFGGGPSWGRGGCLPPPPCPPYGRGCDRYPGPFPYPKGPCGPGRGIYGVGYGVGYVPAPVLIPPIPRVSVSVGLPW